MNKKVKELCATKIEKGDIIIENNIIENNIEMAVIDTDFGIDFISYKIYPLKKLTNGNYPVNRFNDFGYWVEITDKNNIPKVKKVIGKKIIIKKVYEITVDTEVIL